MASLRTSGQGGDQSTISEKQAAMDLEITALHEKHSKCMNVCNAILKKITDLEKSKSELGLTGECNKGQYHDWVDKIWSNSATDQQISIKKCSKCGKEVLRGGRKRKVRIKKTKKRRKKKRRKSRKRRIH